MTSPEQENYRSRQFEASAHRRFWWHQRGHAHYVPPVYGTLTNDEWAVLEEWFKETERLELVGEMQIPFVSVLQALVLGSGMTRIVQLGHYSGYSSLLLGFYLRRIGHPARLVSIDIAGDMTEFSRTWIARAGLDDYVQLVTGDSASSDSRDTALRLLGDRQPQLVIVDSSHQYAQSLLELDLWYPVIEPYGLLVAHDISAFASQYDITGLGGGKRAFDEWCSRNGAPHLAINGDYSGKASGAPIYFDGCGLGLVYKPAESTARRTCPSRITGVVRHFWLRATNRWAPRATG
ncbi:MAG: class I SAM-dependent methyltransferase [Candidatus Schekmanbacteria bacterium]|nr:class I SAM-dependent methyltransferase [Candidatus Schekmanbacteria bacterium]